MTAAHITRESSGSREHRRVLVIEDDAEMSALVAQLLRKDGYEVTLFADGFAALAEIYRMQFRGAQLPHLLVADFRLPGLSGLEVVSRIRRTGCTFPAILMSGFADDELRARAADLRIVAVFDKPFDLNVLRIFVNELFQRQGRR